MANITLASYTYKDSGGTAIPINFHSYKGPLFLELLDAWRVIQQSGVRGGLNIHTGESPFEFKADVLGLGNLVSEDDSIYKKLRESLRVRAVGALQILGEDYFNVRIKSVAMAKITGGSRFNPTLGKRKRQFDFVSCIFSLENDPTVDLT